MQEADTELRHLQDTMREKNRMTAETRLQINTINGVLSGLLANAAEVRCCPVLHHMETDKHVAPGNACPCPGACSWNMRHLSASTL